MYSHPNFPGSILLAPPNKKPYCKACNDTGIMNIEISGKQGQASCFICKAGKKTAHVWVLLEKTLPPRLHYAVMSEDKPKADLPGVDLTNFLWAKVPLR